MCHYGTPNNYTYLVKFDEEHTFWYWSVFGPLRGTEPGTPARLSAPGRAAERFGPPEQIEITQESSHFSLFSLFSPRTFNIASANR